MVSIGPLRISDILIHPAYPSSLFEVYYSWNGGDVDLSQVTIEICGTPVGYTVTPARECFNPVLPDGAIQPLSYAVFGNNADKATNGGFDIDFVLDIPQFLYSTEENSLGVKSGAGFFFDDRFFWSTTSGPFTFRNSN
jgi:hypothetical protein